MKFTTQTLLLLVVSSWALLSTQAFTTTTTTTASSRCRQHAIAQPLLVRQQQQQQLVAPLFSTTPPSPNAEVDALRAAAAKAREEADRLSEELGKKPSVVAAAAAAASSLPKKSADEIKSLLPEILAETDVSKQAAAWQELKDSRSVTAFGSANLRTFPVTLSLLEQRTGLTAETLGLSESEVSLDDFKYATLYVAGGSTVAGIASLAFLPPNVGATFCYLFALIPILFLGIGSTAPAAIADAIALVRGGSSSKTADGGVAVADRVCRHEAAHFCCGYWCGLPVSQYSVENNVARVEFDVAAPSGYSNNEIAALAVTALAGLVGEAVQYNKAFGASQDLLVLDAVLRRSKEFIGAAAQQDITRWGALTAALLLKQNAAKYEQVVAAFQRQAGIDECISILES